MSMMVSPYHTFSTKKVAESLKRKNSQLTQELYAVPIRTISKKRRLVKKFELVSLQRGTMSSFSRKKSSSDKGRERQGQKELILGGQ